MNIFQSSFHRESQRVRARQEELDLSWNLSEHWHNMGGQQWSQPDLCFYESVGSSSTKTVFLIELTIPWYKVWENIATDLMPLFVFGNWTSSLTCCVLYYIQPSPFYQFKYNPLYKKWPQRLPCNLNVFSASKWLSGLEQAQVYVHSLGANSTASYSVHPHHFQEVI